ncbi:MAG TPA: SPFH domain-containing protein [Rubricoccaceae bacterium]|nr:SPFH domain-containing protein [Rubricoccaceae bacterium]
MGLWDRIRGEFIDIIEWTDDSPDTLVYRFERYNNEIKYGAKLVVREGQEAVFVDEGKLADVFPPGTYTLETANIPILSTIQGWKYGFESPFKAEVYFVNTRQFTDQKWGTKNPIMLRDPEFGPLRLRAFGTYAFRVGDPAALIREIVGTDGHFQAGDLANQLRNLIVARFTDVLAESKLAALDLAANYDELGGFVLKRIEEEFKGYGIHITSLLVENISLPPEVEQVLDKRTSMGIVGDLGAYTQFQAAQAMEKAAENPGGMAAGGMGMGMGFAMANQMSQGMGAQGGTPPPLPQGRQFHVAADGQSQGPYDLQTLRTQAQSGRLTRETMVWSQGMEGWQPAGELDALREVFAAVPPPPPPPVSPKADAPPAAPPPPPEDPKAKG